MRRGSITSTKPLILCVAGISAAITGAGSVGQHGGNHLAPDWRG